MAPWMYLLVVKYPMIRLSLMIIGGVDVYSLNGEYVLYSLPNVE